MKNTMKRMLAVLLVAYELACIVMSAYPPSEGRKALYAFLKSAKRLPDPKNGAP